MYRLLKIFTRSLLIRKVLSAITIGGFAISMSVIVILTVFIVEERNVNRSYPNVDNIYRLKMDNNSAQLPQDLLPTLKNEVPGIQKVCFYSSNGALYSLGKEKKLGNFIATNNEFIDIFSHKVLSYNGDINLDIKNQIVITESFRNKLFGAENPTGQVVELNGEVFNISAVISDPPKNSSFEFDGLIGINDAFGRSTWSNGKVTYNQLYAFVELNNKTNESSVAGSISKLLCTYEPWKDRKLLLQPFDEIYFDTDTRSDLKMANRNLITLLSWVALIILVMSIFNFVSLSVSTNIDRIDEIGIKKTMGANKSSIFIQHIFESMLVCMFAFILAIAIAIFISPIFSEIVGKHIDVRTIFTNPTIIVFGITSLVSIGILAGIYPALLASRMSPLKSLQQGNSIKQNRHKSVILTFQFVISIILVSSVLLISKQIKYVKNIDHGFDKDLLVKIHLPRNVSRNVAVFKNKLLENPQILNASATSGGPLNNGISNWAGNVKGFDKQVDMATIGIDANFIETFGLQLLQGRNLRKGERQACLINEHLFKFLEWDDIAGKKISKKKVVGVVKDFHYENMYHPIGNLQLHSSERNNPYILNIKISGIDIAGTISYLKTVSEEFDPATPFEYTFFDDYINTLYKKEEIQAKAIKVFAIIAILISCLGLIGLVEYAIHKKTKEIGIRKVNGAKISEVLVMLNKDFIKWVAVAFVVACPIAYYAMHKWLESFAYKTELSWWIFALAGLLALGIALVTVSWQSWRAATRNPVEALRYE